MNDIKSAVTDFLKKRLSDYKGLCIEIGVPSILEYLKSEKTIITSKLCLKDMILDLINRKKVRCAALFHFAINYVTYNNKNLTDFRLFSTDKREIFKYLLEKTEDGSHIFLKEYLFWLPDEGVAKPSTEEQEDAGDTDIPLSNEITGYSFDELFNKVTEHNKENTILFLIEEKKWFYVLTKEEKVDVINYAVTKNLHYILSIMLYGVIEDTIRNDSGQGSITAYINNFYEQVFVPLFTEHLKEENSKMVKPARVSPRRASKNSKNNSEDIEGIIKNDIYNIIKNDYKKEVVLNIIKSFLIHRKTVDRIATGEVASKPEMNPCSPNFFGVQSAVKSFLKERVSATSLPNTLERLVHGIERNQKHLKIFKEIFQLIAHELTIQTDASAYKLLYWCANDTWDGQKHQLGTSGDSAEAGPVSPKHLTVPCQTPQWSTINYTGGSLSASLDEKTRSHITPKNQVSAISKTVRSKKMFPGQDNPSGSSDSSLTAQSQGTLNQLSQAMDSINLDSRATDTGQTAIKPRPSHFGDDESVILGSVANSLKGGSD